MQYVPLTVIRYSAEARPVEDFHLQDRQSPKCYSVTMHSIPITQHTPPTAGLSTNDMWLSTRLEFLSLLEQFVHLAGDGFTAADAYRQYEGHG